MNLSPQSSLTLAKPHVKEKNLLVMSENYASGITQILLLSTSDVELIESKHQPFKHVNRFDPNHDIHWKTQKPV